MAATNAQSTTRADPTAIALVAAITDAIIDARAGRKSMPIALLLTTARWLALKQYADEHLTERADGTPDTFGGLPVSLYSSLTRSVALYQDGTTRPID